MTKLDEAMDSPAGAMYRRIAELKFALRERFKVGLEDITMEEFHAFQVCTMEQERYERRQNKAGK